jgi:hypothetical protein
VKLILLVLSSVIAFSQSFAAMNIACSGFDEDGLQVQLNAYPQNNGTDDMAVSLHDQKGFEYNYSGLLSLHPRHNVHFWIYGRGLNFIVYNKLDKETVYRATLTADHTSQTYQMTCQF